jgi:hypothetical protein
MLAGAFSLTGCAAMFRDSKTPVHVESDPPGASVAVEKGAANTPLDVPVPRKGLTEVRMNMQGFEEHHGTVRKHVNGLWLVADLATCIVPLLLCVPLFVDAVSGAWYDVEPRYRAHLVPLGLAVPAAYNPGSIYVVRPPSPQPAPSATPAPVVVTPPAPTVTISESERKAAARAAFQEGMELQGQKSYAEALARFQYAERVFDAPTHHLHIAQCLVMTGKLVEAQESYETLTHRELPPGSPAPFKEAVDIGKRELAELQPRIPTLRIEVTPAPATLRNLVLLLNGRPLPNEVIGIARPVNPGSYRITATAWGIPPSKPVDITLAERENRAVDVHLGR